MPSLQMVYLYKYKISNALRTASSGSLDRILKIKNSSSKPSYF